MEKHIMNKLKSNSPAEGAYIAFPSTIAGYHHFKIKPIPGLIFPMTLHREPSNSHHINAIMVTSNVKSKFPDQVIKLADGRSVFDKQVGRVPREIADIIAPFLDNGEIIKGLAFYTGKIIQKGNQEGGGPHLTCVYFLKVKSANEATALHEQLKAYGCILIS